MRFQGLQIFFKVYVRVSTLSHMLIVFLKGIFNKYLYWFEIHSKLGILLITILGKSIS